LYFFLIEIYVVIAGTKITSFFLLIFGPRELQKKIYNCLSKYP
jgi:hypothetical protein